MSDSPVPDEADLKIKYLDDYPDLPADAPFGCPHIVDLSFLDEEYPQDEMSIPDLIATVLFKYKPVALRAFLDLDRPEVHFVNRPPYTLLLDFCIQRTGRIVKIGYLNGRKAGGWYELYKYRIDADATGKWTPIAWQGADGQIENDLKEILKGVPRFARATIYDELWDQDEPDVEIEWFAGLLQGRKH